MQKRYPIDCLSVLKVFLVGCGKSHFQWQMQDMRDSLQDKDVVAAN